jgi:hypothetical protein
VPFEPEAVPEEAPALDVESLLLESLPLESEELDELDSELLPDEPDEPAAESEPLLPLPRESVR